MMIKFVELASCEISIRHLMHLFVPSFHRGTMIHLHHRRTKGLVAGMNDKANCHFWFNFFYIKTENVVVSPSGFSHQWNFARKCVCRLKYAHFLSFVVFWFCGLIVLFSFQVAEKHTLSLVVNISDWMAQILPHIVGIHDWASFNKEFRPKPSTDNSDSNLRPHHNPFSLLFFLLTISLLC